MTIEDLRGRQFVHYKDGSFIYIVGKSVDGQCIIHWGETDTTAYWDEQVVDYFERGIWVEVK